MSKECRECDYFFGYDDVGCPECEVEGGYEQCPYNDEAPSGKGNGSRIEIDTEFFTEYIRHTMKNTFHREARRIAEDEIRHFAKDEYEKQVRAITEEEVRRIVAEQIAEFMAGDVTVGGGWDSPSRTIPRNQYMSELVKKELERLEKDRGIVETCKKVAGETIEKFSRSVKDQVNRAIKDTFDTATRDALTANVVNMLMANDTYKKLSDSMTNVLGQ